MFRISKGKLAFIILLNLYTVLCGRDGGYCLLFRKEGEAQRFFKVIQLKLC